jgi:hypothetical protein
MDGAAGDSTHPPTSVTATVRSLGVELDVRTVLGAPRAAVWTLLEATADYASWNPLVQLVTGPLDPGASLELELRLPGRRGPRRALVTRTVTSLDPGRALCLGGHRFVPSLLGTLDAIELRDIAGSDGCELVQRASFSGVAALVLQRRITTTYATGICAMHRAIAAVTSGER